MKENKKRKLTISQRLARGERDYKEWSDKFETNPRLKKIYTEESAKVELWLQLAEARQAVGLTPNDRTKERKI